MGQDLFQLHAAGFGVCHGYAKLPAGSLAVILDSVKGGRMLQRGGYRIGAEAGVFHNGADNLEHTLGGGQFGDEGAGTVFCAKNDLHNIPDAIGLYLFEHQ